MALPPSRRMADAFISNNEREFIQQALREGVRADGRAPLESRPLSFAFSLDGATCAASLGATRALAAVSAELRPPPGGRPSEGSLTVNVELSPMASPGFEAGRPGRAAAELARLLDRGLRLSGALDMEALCVAAGRAAWALRLDVHVLDHGGNYADAAGLAALGALAAFRRPAASVAPLAEGKGGGERGARGGGARGFGAGGAPAGVTLHPPAEREPLPLTLHHLPVPATFALFDGGAAVALDPTRVEEAAAGGALTAVVNTQGEVCAVQKARGCGLPQAQVAACLRLAARRAADAAAVLKAALAEHEAARVAARVLRHPGAAAAAAAAAVAARGARAAVAMPPALLAVGALPAGAGALAQLASDEFVQQARKAAAADDMDEGGEAEASGDDDAEELPLAGGALRGPAAPLLPPAAAPQVEQQQQQQQGVKRKAPAASAGLEAVAAAVAAAGGGSGPPDLAAAVRQTKR